MFYWGAFVFKPSRVQSKFALQNWPLCVSGTFSLSNQITEFVFGLSTPTWFLPPLCVEPPDLRRYRPPYLKCNILMIHKCGFIIVFCNFDLAWKCTCSLPLKQWQTAWRHLISPLTSWLCPVWHNLFNQSALVLEVQMSTTEGRRTMRDGGAQHNIQHNMHNSTQQAKKRHSTRLRIH